MTIKIGDETLRGAGEVGPASSTVLGIAAFYHAMSLQRRGQVDEARWTAIEAAAAMPLFPTDEKNPLIGNGVTWENLIVWLACREARDLIGFDAPPAVVVSGAK